MPAAMEALEGLRPAVFATLRREKLPKGFAKKLSCKFVSFSCDVIHQGGIFYFRDRKTPEDLKRQYKEIISMLRKVNKDEGKTEKRP